MAVDKHHLASHPGSLANTPKECLRALVEKYSGNIPRYTSYPTAVEFTDQVNSEGWSELLTRQQGNPSSAAIYVHVPFCEQLCYFCACNKIITEDHSSAREFLNSVASEVKIVRELVGSHPIEQIHWGGGSPNFLSPTEMTELFNVLHGAFPDLPKHSEVSIEVDPRRTTNEQLETLVSLGFNRLSFGVQDLDPKVQTVINRIQPYELTKDILLTARRLGFSGINIDLIYGLPEQTEKSFHETVAKVIELKPDRIALYGYAHVAWISKTQNSFNRSRLPTPHERVELFLLALHELSQAGYVYIGLDHFALPEDTLTAALQDRRLRRNFMGYTVLESENLFGFGPSAISSLNSGFAQNYKDLPTYQSTLASGALPTQRGLVRSVDDQLRGEIIGAVLTHGVVSADRLSDPVFANNLIEQAEPVLAEFVEDGFLVMTEQGFVVTTLGRIFSRSIASLFDSYLPKHQNSEKKVFSQSV